MGAVAEPVNALRVATRSRVGSDKYLAALGGLVVLAALLRLPGLGSQSFWYDESLTVKLAYMDPVHMFRAVADSESNPPLYYALAWGWSRVFGFGEVGLRSLSAVLGIATVPVAYAAASALVSRRAGLVTAALVATSPFLVWYSQEARAYSLVVLAAAASLYFFARAREGFEKGPLVGWAAVSAIALTAHYGAFLLIAPEAVWLVVQAGSRRRVVLRAVAAIGAVGLALLPLLLHQRPTADWIGQYPLGPRVAQVPRVFLGGVSSPTLYLTIAIGLLWAGGLALVLVRGHHHERRAALLAAGLGAAGVGTAILLALTGNDVLLARNLIMMWLPIAVAAASGFASRRAGRLGLAAAGAAAALSAAIVLATLSDESLQRADWRAAANTLGAATGPRLVVAPGDYNNEPLTLSLDGLQDPRPAHRFRVAEVDVLGFDRPSGYACWSGAACNLPRVRASLAPPASGFRLVSRRKTGLFDVVTFKASRPTTIDSAKLVGSRVGSARPRSRALLQTPPDRSP